jgi:flagellar hook protein FlgE
MMRSMFSGVSGLRAHQTKMDVIGNNVANVNTVGFKSGRVTFQEVFSQTLKGAGAPDASSGRGGTNAMQVGLGIGVASVDTITTRGSLQRTDNPTDLSIEGDGFFIVQGGRQDTFRFTRAGNFGLDKTGNLVADNGMNVMGWQTYSTDANGASTFDTEKPLEAINLYSDSQNGNKRMIAAKATSNAVFAGNLKSFATAADTFSIPMTVYDDLGTAYKINVDFTKGASVAGVSTTWNWTMNTGADATASSVAGTAAIGSLTFGANGQLDPATAGPTFDNFISPISANTGVKPFAIKLDFTKLSMFASDFSAKPTNIDGYSTGDLVTFNIGSDGILTGIYSNGQQQPLGMVGLAGFDNSAGLQKVGENMYIPTTNSGDFKKGLKPGGQGVGTLNPGTLEMSNVDLSKEFTDMIITQRGFQANSRIITTSDEMLQELVNLKR